jgi:exfoliative toxin A/B
MNSCSPFLNVIKKTPVAICGLALALSSVGNLLAVYGEPLQHIPVFFSFLLIVLFLLKTIFDFENLKTELQSPIILGVLPTFTMTLMFLATYAKPYAGFAAVCLWYLAILAHVLIMGLFFKRFVMNFDMQKVFPSWIVACVGIVAASVTSPAMEAQTVGKVLFYVGFTLYFFIMPIVLYRLFKSDVPEPARPTIAIITAPMSLCVAGYFSVFTELNAVLLYMMLALVIVSYLFVTVKMFSLLKLNFYPSYSAFTFPYVISATAFNLFDSFFAAQGIYVFALMSLISMLIAALLVVYVLAHYIAFFIHAIRVEKITAPSPVSR